MSEENQEPEIAPVVLRPDAEREKNRGWLASLLLKFGIPAGSSYKGGAGLAASVLASKAGIVALILAGTTVAAGIGVIGPSLWSPRGVEDQALMSSIFTEARLKAGASGESASAADKSQPASSLDYWNRDNASAGSAESGAQAAGDEASGSGSGGSEVESKSGANASQVASNVTGAKAQLSKSPSFSNPATSGGSMFAQGQAQPAGGGSPSMRGALGGTSAFPVNRARDSGGGGKRALLPSGALNALGQAGAAKTVGQNAAGSAQTSMQNAGTPFDAGAAAAGGALIGAGRLSGGPDSKPGPNPEAKLKDLPAPPKPKPIEAPPPYQWAFNAALAALAAAVGFLLLAKMMSGNLLWARVFAGMATVAALTATSMGALIATSYGQMMEGLGIAGAGGVLAFMAMNTLSNINKEAKAEMAKRAAALKQEAARKLAGKQFVAEIDAKAKQLALPANIPNRPRLAPLTKPGQVPTAPATPVAPAASSPPSIPSTVSKPVSAEQSVDILKRASASRPPSGSEGTVDILKEASKSRPPSGPDGTVDILKKVSDASKSNLP